MLSYYIQLIRSQYCSTRSEHPHPTSADYTLAHVERIFTITKLHKISILNEFVSGCTKMVMPLIAYHGIHLQA